jgi:HD-like signal output (HDOD) protein
MADPRPGTTTPAPSAGTSPGGGATSTAGAAPGPPLEAVAAGITEISTLPNVALRVMQVASDPTSEAEDLRHAIESDPALCVRVLRCVNSASFGLRSRIADLGQAVSYLGFNQIRDLAITATVCDLFRGSRRILSYDRGGLWRHLVAVGVCSRMIATRLRLEGYRNAFLAGLLHDLGIILFDQYRHEDFHRVIAGLNTSKPLIEFEHKFVPWDHTELGYVIGERWRLPEVSLAAIRWHHDPASCPPPHGRLVHCVAVANVACSSKGITSVGPNLVGLPPASLDALQIETRDVTVYADDLDAELLRHQHLFDILG